MSLATQLKQAAVEGEVRRGFGGPRTPSAAEVIQRFQQETAPAAVGRHIIRDGGRASALRTREDVGARAPMATLGSRAVADNSTASQPTSDHLPANPSDELPTTNPADFASALVGVKRKVAGLKAQGVDADLVHQAMMQDVVRLARQHGVIPGAGSAAPAGDTGGE